MGIENNEQTVPSHGYTKFADFGYFEINIAG